MVEVPAGGWIRYEHFDTLTVMFKLLQATANTSRGYRREILFSIKKHLTLVQVRKKFQAKIGPCQNPLFPRTCEDELNYQGNYVSEKYQLLKNVFDTIPWFTLSASSKCRTNGCQQWRIVSDVNGRIKRRPS